MKTTDYRDMTWEQVRGHLVEDRLKVYDSLMVWGPCTTRQLAAFMGRDVLSVRPRVTELCQMGFAVEAEVAAEKRRADGAAREGYYETVPMALAESAHKFGRCGVQAELKLGGM